MADFAALTLSIALTYGQTAPVLHLPVDCVLGETCFIQKHVDHDPSEGRLDYQCGNLTTDGHNGVDFRLRGVPDLEDSVPVIAAASGRVVRIRGGVPDRNVRLTNPQGMVERQAGNAVVVDHGDGWETQYNHLQLGSLTVVPGDKVETGDVLGRIGMSGNAEFPHIDFAVRKDGQTVDPFLGQVQSATTSIKCDGDHPSTDGALWAADVLSALDYRSSGILQIGVTTSSEAALHAYLAPFPSTTLTTAVPALVVWINAFGVKAGDVERFTLTGPNGDIVHDSQSKVKKGGLSWRSYSGKRRPKEGWTPGSYRVRYVVLRNGLVLDSATTSVEITGP